MKIVTIKGLWLLHWCTKFHIDISSRLWVIGVWNIENWTHKHSRTHAHTHTHTSGRQLKITFLDVLDYSEYSDTNISNIFFLRKHSFLTEEEKSSEHCRIFWKFRFFEKWRQVQWNRKQFFLLKLRPFFEKPKFRKNPTMLNSFYIYFQILSRFLF